MAVTDAVTSTAVARREARQAIERLRYHLNRGARGRRGVDREVRFLDALHRRSIAQAGRAVGTPYTANVAESFGRKAADALRTGNAATIGRSKSSILADFSADSLQPARDQASLLARWTWTANASACPTCLFRHGARSAGTFVPAHPSCLCIPQHPETSGLRPLTDDEAIEMWEQHGDQRYRPAVEQFKKGEISRNRLGKIEAVNDTRRGRSAWQRHQNLQQAHPEASAAGPGSPGGSSGGNAGGTPPPSGASPGSPNIDPLRTSLSEQLPDRWGNWSSSRKLRWIEDKMEADMPLNPATQGRTGTYYQRNLQRNTFAFDGRTRVDLTGMDPDLTLANMDRIRKHLVDYPDIAEKLNYIGTIRDVGKVEQSGVWTWDPIFHKKLTHPTSRPWSGAQSDSMARVNRNTTYSRNGSVAVPPSEHLIAINPKYYKTWAVQTSERNYGININYYPARTNTPVSTITHEFGHLIEAELREVHLAGAGRFIAGVDSTTDRASLRHLYAEWRQQVNEVSDYAKNNQRERFAEWYSHHYEAASSVTDSADRVEQTKTWIEVFAGRLGGSEIYSQAVTAETAQTAKIVEDFIQLNLPFMK